MRGTAEVANIQVTFSWASVVAMDMTLTKIVQYWIINAACITGVLSVATHNIYSSGCGNERIMLECPPAHKVAIKRLFYGIKREPGCARAGRQHSPDCCQPTHTDCLVVNDQKYPFLNMLCSGQNSCDIETNNISSGQHCVAKGYSPTTDYMSVIHDCIPDEDIVSLCSDRHKKGKLLYLSNENYPFPIAAGKQRCQCLIKTGSKVGIDMHALDILITRADSGDECYQEVELRDEDGHKKEINCGNHGLYAFRNIYNSEVRSVTLTFTNQAPKSQGYIWVQAKAKEDRDYIDIFCGESMRRHLGYPDSESRTLDSQNAGDKSSSGAGLTPGAAANATQADTPNVMSDMMALFVGIGVAVAMVIIIGLIGIVILCVRRRRQKRVQRVEPPPFPSPMLKNKEDKHSSNTYCHYDYDEDKYCSIKRSPMRLTKYSDVTSDHKLKEAFAQGLVAPPPDFANQNGYMNYGEELCVTQVEPLLDSRCQFSEEEEEEADEVIMPHSEYIAIGKAIQPRTTNKQLPSTKLPEKKNLKTKTVTFSPVAMVTPLPSESLDCVDKSGFVEEVSPSYVEMYSKTLPHRSPDKSKKVMVAATRDDMCLPSLHTQPDCENVTEEDLWQAFHIKLTDNVKLSAADPPSPTKPVPELAAPPLKADDTEGPDYDENPYDNLPYINLGSLRRHNAPEELRNLYKDSVKRTMTSQKPRIDTIQEAC